MNPNVKIMTTSLNEKSAKTAVKLLRRTCKKIAEVESNVKLFTKMTKFSVATNDVRSFLCNQIQSKRVNKKLNSKSIKHLMRQKLNDACSQLNILKQKRVKLRKSTLKLCSNGKKLVEECDGEAKVTKNRQDEKNSRKFEWNKLKQDKLNLSENVPEGVE